MNSFKWQIIVLFAIFILWTVAGYFLRDILLIESALVVATILMASFVAYQALATLVMAQQAQEQVKQMVFQAQLTQQSLEKMGVQVAIMGETLVEMKKERMNIEYIKNEAVGYIKTIENILSNSLSEAWPAYSKLPSYSNSALDSSFGALGLGRYQKQGMKERLKRKIQKLMEEYNINIEEYNSLVETANNLRQEAIDALKKEPEIINSLQRISYDEARKFHVIDTHIIKPNTLLEELVLLFNIEDDCGLSAPPYGRLGLNSETERLYGLGVWNKAREEFYEFLKRRPKIYNTLAARGKSLKELKELTKELLERIHKIEEELLLQGEDKLEKKLMEL